MLRIQTTDNPKGEAGAYINSLLASYADKPVLLMLPGGSSREIIDLLDGELLTDQVTITVTDERYTDDLEENNFAHIQGTHFYNDSISAGSFCIDTQIFSGESHEEHAKRFDKNLKEWKRDFPKGKIIALFGVGKDGHIAGMIPGTENFEEKFNNREIYAIDLVDTKFERTTTTFPFLKQIDFPLVYISGMEKSDALARIVAKEGDLEHTPARILNEMKDPIVFTDISVEKA
jgi:6-phosphogluconolactonase/glucosamine-6-phosphate isomerase/deaminase